MSVWWGQKRNVATVWKTIWDYKQIKRAVYWKYMLQVLVVDQNQCAGSFKHVCASLSRLPVNRIQPLTVYCSDIQPKGQPLAAAHKIMAPTQSYTDKTVK